MGIYLQNHEAAAQASADLFRRTAVNQRTKPYGDELHTLTVDVKEDLKKLRFIMWQAGVRPNPVLGLTLRLGERAGRLKPNGQLLRRAPLSDLIEIEGLLDAVSIKRAAWQALAAVPPSSDLDQADIEDLIARADHQIARLGPIHSLVAAKVLTTG